LLFSAFEEEETYFFLAAFFLAAFFFGAAFFLVAFLAAFFFVAIFVNLTVSKKNLTIVKIKT